jgi:AAA domain
MHQTSVHGQSELLDLQHILAEMDQALADEIFKQSNYKQVKHTAIEGKLLTEGNGQYIYLFTLTEPWEPQDDAPLTVANKNVQNNNYTVVNSKGTTITISSDAPLPPDVLHQIDFCDDSTELLKRLKETLKHVDEGNAKLGSKSFGLLPYREANYPSAIAFGNHHPHTNQLKAAQMALGGEVTYIVGPPGTGKTLTLAAIAFEHLRAGHTVLIAAHTNIAIDNAIMKLCDLCNDKDTGNNLLLEQGLVVRYGAVQKAELKESKQYAEVYLPKIAQRQGVTLNEQRESLKKTLHDLDQKMSTLRQQQPQNEEQYQSQSALISRQLESLHKELVPLEQEERRRISSLQSRRNQHELDLQTAEHELMDANQQLARTRAEIEEMRVALAAYRQDEQKWLVQLVDARAMSKVNRFFKGINSGKLELKVSEATHGIQETEQKLASLGQELEVRHTTLSERKQKKQFCEEAFNRVNIELSTPSIVINHIQHLREQVNIYQRSLREIEATHEQQQQAYQRETRNAATQRSPLEKQLATIDQQLRDVEQSIVAQARVVGTTLSKTYMNKTIASRRFDAVILDEVSMAPLPLVYIATSHADSSVTLIGDPQQLAPIVTAETPLAKKWLGRDLFVLRDISLDAAVEGIKHSVMLDVQSRMHPQISAIAIT